MEEYLEILEETYRTLASLDDILRGVEATDGTKLYWTGRAVSECAQRLRPICEPKTV